MSSGATANTLTEEPAQTWWLDHFDEPYEQFMARVRPPASITAEVVRITSVLDHAPGRITTLLDAPCGGGEHALELARIGYQVHGVDLSTPMVRSARRRIAAAGAIAGTCTVEQADLHTWHTDQSFDAALNWFSSLGYTTDPADDVTTLGTLRRALRRGGTLLLESEHLARLQHHFVSRYEAALGDDARIVGECLLTDDGRFEDRHTVTIAGAAVERRLTMRIYTIDQLARLCTDAGFDVVEIIDPAGGGPTTSNTRALLVARAS